MGFLVRYWYLILLAFTLSIGSAIGLLYLQRDSWVPKPEPKEPKVFDQMPGMSPEYSEWNYEVTTVEDLRVKMEAELEEIRLERNELEIFRQRVQSEARELTRLRDEIQAIRDAINADYIEIEEAESANIQQLARVYTEMKPDAAVAILSSLDIELVVKILSRMGNEPASGILEEMASGAPGSETARMASQITELMQLMK